MTQLSIVEGPPLASDPSLGELTLPGWFLAITQRFADREALVARGAADDAIVRWSYAELHRHAHDVACALTAQAIGKGEVVAVLMTNRPEWLASVFGIALAGGVAAPLSTFSTPSELEYLLGASGASTLLFEPRVLKKEFRRIIEAAEPAILTSEPGRLASVKFPYLRRLVALEGEAQGAVESWEAFLASGDAVEPGAVEARTDAVSPADPALLYFSSGSTGRPKGVLNANRGVAVQCWRYPGLLGLREDRGIRGWSANGFFWSGSFVQGIGGTLGTGGSLVLQATFDAARALDLFEQERVNYLVCWPHQYAQFAAAPNWPTVDLGSLEYVASGTAIDDHPTVQRTWIEPPWAYGSTETFTINTFFPYGTSALAAGQSHGAPLSGNRLKIVDPFTGHVVARGEKGEIAIKGATLMMGYLGTPLDETLDDEGYFRTGDGGYIDDKGRLVWEGRLNDIIKTGGANVSPIEIDDTLRAFPGVKVAQTVGVPDALYGEAIVACIVAHEGASLTVDALHAYAKERLASYKVPKVFLFMAESELKTTSSSKIITAELRKIALERIRQGALSSKTVAPAS